MDRRTFLATVAGSLLAAPLAAEAQQAGKVYRVGLIFPSPLVSEMTGPEPVNVAARAFVRGLRALGYAEGRNLILERRSAEGTFERFAPIVAELVSLNVDVIVVSSTPLAQRAREVTTAVPIVLGISTDPVGSGLAQSLARPGGNVTGLTSDVGPEIQGKRLELLKGAVPRASRVAFLGTKKLWDVVYEKSIKAGAQALGLTVFLAEHTPTDYTGAFTLISRERPDALFVAPSSENYAQRRLIVDFATSKRLPNIHAFMESVEDGGLMSYGVNIADLFRRAAGYVDKILKGAKPGQVRVGHQPQDGQGPRADDPPVAPAARRPGDRVSRPSSWPERGPHGRQQGLEADGFDEDARVGRKGVLGEGLKGVAAHEDHLDLWPPVLHSLGDLEPAAAGHHDVREQKVDGARIFVQHREGALGVARRQDPVSPRLQDVLYELHEGRFVVDDQHGRGHERLSE